MNKNEPLYSPASFFMVRTPLFPIEDFFLFSKSSDSAISLSQFPDKQKAIFLEAIAVASPSLYKALIEGVNNDQTQRSLLKYFLRMATRATPFGLFSFVSSGRWNQNTSVQFDLSKVSKRIRPDMEWLFAIINQLSTDPTLLPHLLVHRNPLLFESTGRICLNYFRKKKEGDNSSTISIRSSFLTSAIFENTIHPIKFTELLEIIVQQHPALEIEKVKGVLVQLIEQQYISLSIQPSLLTESPFNDLLEKLSSTPYSKHELQNISNKMEDYNQTSIGDGDRQLAAVQQAMEKMTKTTSLIQVDLCHKKEGNTLPHHIAKEVAEAAEVLWRISNEIFVSRLSTYHNKFTEKYGIYRAIPLLDLLHEESGLGIPEHYKTPTSEQPPKDLEKEKWKKWLKNQWIHCLHEGKVEIEVTEEVLNKIEEKPDRTKAAPSLDLFFEIIANSSQEIDEGKYLISIVNNSSQGGATFGRFLDLMGDQTKEELRRFLFDEEAQEKGCLFAQSSYLSFIPRNANVSIHPNLRRYAIDIGGNGNIPLNDIYVGSTGERFYLTLKDSQNELVVTSGNMLVNEVAPIPLRFIRDISRERYRPGYGFSWMDLYDSPFLPRVRFKKNLLSLAKWRVDLLQLGLSIKDSPQKIENGFLEWAKKWKLPRYCYIGEEDQLILIDHHHPEHLKEVISQIKKDRPVIFTEKIGQENGQWIRSEQGNHFSEFVLPLIKNPKYAYPSHKPYPIQQRSEVSADYRKPPGSEWLYVKCYLGAEQENYFLIDQFSRFAKYAFEQKIISDWFFVRYGDEKSHLRLRFRGENDGSILQLIPILYDWTESLIREKNINEMILLPYEREVERYGGEKLIESAESLFCADSRTTLTMLNDLARKKINIKEEILAAVSLIEMLKSLGLSIKDQLSFYSTLNLPKKELVGFREDKSLLIPFAEAILKDELTQHSKEGTILNEAFHYRRPSLKNFSDKLVENQMSGELLFSQDVIYDSIIHMHCNRLLGRDPKKESKARLYAYNTLLIIDKKMQVM
jgi:lantibiotic biosynthesis protein